MSSPRPSSAASIKLLPDGRIDYVKILKEQHNLGTMKDCTNGIDYLKRTSTPRKEYGHPDPLSSHISEWGTPRRCETVTVLGRPSTTGGRLHFREDSPGATIGNALCLSELDFHLQRVTDLLRRAPHPSELPEEICQKIRQIAAYEAFLKRV